MNCGSDPAGTLAGSNGSVTVTGTAKVVPCGVNANVAPIGVIPLGSGTALAAICVIAIGVLTASAPGGITTFVPFGPFTVPPAGPIPLCGGGGGAFVVPLLPSSPP